MKDSELIRVPRTRKNTLVGEKKQSLLKLDITTGRFFFNAKATKELNLHDNTGLMFYFNEKNKTAFFEIEQEEDSYLVKKRENGSSFSAKDLLEYFDKIFNLVQSGDLKFFFKIDTTVKTNGLYQLTLCT